jgi:hypothetical protein
MSDFASASPETSNTFEHFSRRRCRASDALIEALLRMFLRIPDEKKVSFDDLVRQYRSYLESERYSFPTFIDELTKFNRWRNRVVHQLWRKGHSFTNRQTESAARGAVMMYGLLIEWLETFDPEITTIGFRYDVDG